MKFHRTLLFATLLSLGISVVGCGSEKPKMVNFSGKVIHQGKPVTAGSIYFFPDVANGYQKDNPSSMLQLDGSFTAKTFPFGDGIPPGTYKVTLAPQLASRLNAAEYSDPVKSPWKVVVPEAGLSDQVLDVKVNEANGEGS